ncbi:putative thiol methyltransferase 2 [Fulvia fulva]|uniref:Thiol methyltransferase 2 n=1 Tax=Passalora fulva TaxID=5499 RepID=A0A9Q8LE73_PASFU|nr:putative thiol methyltransferase 2 [Fulvia fulva]KAK4627241.1 putative thiol methyltransferase 2 [Fulvia fulva]KAK4627704.1 putative thiol methyltransferase 2 [Fulvia fulva]UJO15783.1 putative thiol methyltransferase 2 [Fulvia fulva]WPV14149.1 putative thiol methyltransferase 2 [Fulvia fulva]WPV29092.1 putative thiol methyltransferase 2 [Fulvia fulva]
MRKLRILAIITSRRLVAAQIPLPSGIRRTGVSCAHNHLATRSFSTAGRTTTPLKPVNRPFLQAGDVLKLDDSEIMAGTFPQDAREKLRQQFLDQPEEDLTKKWDEAWQKKQTPWDKNGPSLALKDAIADKHEIFGSATKDDSSQTRKRALVPGCGSGYDVFLLASLGYDTYGLDAAPTAVEAAKRIQNEVPADERYAVHNAKTGRGEANVLLQDFFKDDFQEETGGADFDVIFDYTFLCALPPDLRPRWAKRMSQLLGPTGNLICLEWPLGKDPKQGGPPHGVTPELFEQLLRRPGEQVKYDEAGVVVQDQSNGQSDAALVKVERFLPSRTHESTKGNDHVSIWQHLHSSNGKATL